MCMYHNFTMEVSLPQFIDTKKHTKTARSSRVTVHYIEIDRKTLQFYKGYFIIFYHLKTSENKEFYKFKQKKSDIFTNSVKFTDFCHFL